MIRVGVVGAGLIGRERLIAIRTLKAQGKQVELSGIVDANDALREKTAAEFAVPAFSNLEEPSQRFAELGHGCSPT